MTEQATETGTAPAKRKHDIPKAPRHTCEACHLSAPAPIVERANGPTERYLCSNAVPCSKRQRILMAKSTAAFLDSPTEPTKKRVVRPKGAT